MGKKMHHLWYLGPRGTFSEIAAHIYSKGKGWQLVECSSLESIINRVASGMLEKGIVPVENTTVGTVGIVYDLLAGSYDLTVQGEVIVPVVHSLLARPKVSVKGIEKVFSHSQAIAQCRGFLREKLPYTCLQECASSSRGCSGS